MLPSESVDLDRVFHALAHPLRREVLRSLSEGPQTIVKMARPFDVSLNAVSKHVKTLEAAGLVRRRRDGNFHRVSLHAPAMRPALVWMERYTEFWSHNLTALKGHMEDRATEAE